jgi:D-alanine-D-alanine ligase
MRIALTHCLQPSAEGREIGSDGLETVAAITEALRQLGHDVEVIEVSRSTSALVIRLEALKPDLVFNTAQGRGAPFEKAVYPALFEMLKLPFTGSDAHVSTLTSDFHLTMMMATSHGVKIPRVKFVSSIHNRILEGIKFPVILKPNAAGRSTGMSVEAVVETPQLLNRRLTELVKRFPDGILVEEFIPGRDVAVVYLEGGPLAIQGALEPVTYEYDTSLTDKSKHDINDLVLNSEKKFPGLGLGTPERLSPELRERVLEISRRLVEVFNPRDFARFDLRVGETGEIYLLGIDTLPSLSKGSLVSIAAEYSGLAVPRDVVEAIVESAVKRHKIAETPKPTARRDKELSIALTFNIKRTSSKPKKTADEDAEFDSPTTIGAIHQALESHGHRVVELEATSRLPVLLADAGVDIAFNIAEGSAGRHRESQVPALLELLNIPYSGSDPTTLSLALDKSLAKLVVSQAGGRTAPFLIMVSGQEKVPDHLTFPVMVKPVAEGSSKGIGSSSVVENPDQLRAIARHLIDTYQQPALVESYLPGREFTMGLLGETRPRVLPPMEVIFTNPQTKHPIYDFATKFENKDVRFEVPARVTDELRMELEKEATIAFVALGCRDFARVDFRLDEQGRVNFIECNPLPGLSPGFSDFCVIAEKSGMSYQELIGEMIAPCIRRWRDR